MRRTFWVTRRRLIWRSQNEEMRERTALTSAWKAGSSSTA